MKFPTLPPVPRSFLLAGVAAFGVMILVAAGGLYYSLFSDRSHSAAKATVIIVRGTTFGEAAERVEKAGVASAWQLRLLERLRRHDGEIAAGQFNFAPHLTAAEVYEQLKSTALPVAHWVTIPEGFTAAQIGARLLRSGFTHAGNFGTYATHHSIQIGDLKTASLEGYLFPSTYLVADEADAPAIAAEMVAEFRRQFPHDAQKQAAKLHATVPDIVTVASLIEREAKRNDERPLMAGVYYHRLHIGMPLEVDATLEYGFASHHSVITASDLAKDTPYNSYKHFGLPPTPIANPGLPSLLAALHPVQTPYLYYVYRGGGRHAFAATLEEHNQNVARYLR